MWHGLGSPRPIQNHFSRIQLNVLNSRKAISPSRMSSHIDGSIFPAVLSMPKISGGANCQSSSKPQISRKIFVKSG